MPKHGTALLLPLCAGEDGIVQEESADKAEKVSQALAPPLIVTIGEDESCAGLHDVRDGCPSTEQGSGRREANYPSPRLHISTLPLAFAGAASRFPSVAGEKRSAAQHPRSEADEKE